MVFERGSETIFSVRMRFLSHICLVYSMVSLIPILCFVSMKLEPVPRVAKVDGQREGTMVSTISAIIGKVPPLFEGKTHVFKPLF